MGDCLWHSFSVGSEVFSGFYVTTVILPGNITVVTGAFVAFGRPWFPLFV